MIKKITIEIQGKDIDLTLEEAKKLKEDLSDLFPQPQYYPYYYPWWFNNSGLFYDYTYQIDTRS